MELTDAGEVTELLELYRAGDDRAFARLLPLVQAELHRIAERELRRERPGHTLQPTALINEAVLALLGQREKEWASRAHFLAVAAMAIREVLIAYARKRHAAKRGGRQIRVTFSEELAESAPREEEIELVALDDALRELAEENERQARVVELRYFGGLTVEETAEVLRTSPRTVKRDWMVARAWLFRRLQGQLGA